VIFRRCFRRRRLIFSADALLFYYADAARCQVPAAHAAADVAAIRHLFLPLLAATPLTLFTALRRRDDADAATLAPPRMPRALSLRRFSLFVRFPDVLFQR
jgi:hypothetical protein